MPIFWDNLFCHFIPPTYFAPPTVCLYPEWFLYANVDILISTGGKWSVDSQFCILLRNWHKSAILETLHDEFVTEKAYSLVKYQVHISSFQEMDQSRNRLVFVIASARSSLISQGPTYVIL